MDMEETIEYLNKNIFKSKWEYGVMIILGHWESVLITKIDMSHFMEIKDVLNLPTIYENNNLIIKSDDVINHKSYMRDIKINKILGYE